MINVFKVKKYAALLLMGFSTVLLFVIGNIYYGFIGGLGFMFAGMFMGVLVSTLMLKNPFTDMLEGKGILALNLDSTGVIQPFIVSVRTPYIFGKLKGRRIMDVFDRSTVKHLAVPKKAEKVAEFKQDGGVIINLTQKKYNEARFAMFHYPCLLYNEQIGSVITKDWLADKEKDSFAEHGVLYLNRKMEELTSFVRDFGRHVVETLKPQESIFKNKWTWIIIAIVLIILGALFAPSIINSIKGVSGSVGGAFGAASGNTIMPR